MIGSKSVWETVAEWGLLNLTSLQVQTDPKKTAALRGVMYVLGEPIEKGNCIRCISDALKALKRYDRQNKADEMAKKGKAKSEAKYILNEVMVAFNGAQYSPRNITDEVAKAMLRQDPAKSVLFSSLPENWELEVQVREEQLSKTHEPVKDSEKVD